MSKIGKKLINIPYGVKIDIENNEVFIKGPLGEKIFKIPENFDILKENNSIKIKPKYLNRKTKTLWGTYRSILNNEIIGVKEGFKIDLILEGLGYTAEVKGNEIIFKLGLSHPIKINIPEDLKVEIKPLKGQHIITVKGIDKQKVGQYAAYIRSIKPRDSYKLKGFRYIDELVKSKTVKKGIGK